MSEARRQRAQRLVLDQQLQNLQNEQRAKAAALDAELASKVEEAPSTGLKYVRTNGAWSVSPTLVTSWESGTAYYDGAVSLYVVYGADGNWQATRATSTQTLSTAAGQTGTKPSTLATLRSLSYS